MPFNSVEYLLFLPIVVALYHACPVPARPALLLLASYVFYASYNVALVLLIIGLTAVNYGFGRWLDRTRDRPRTMRAILALGVTIDIGVLATFKYTLFLIHSLGSVLGWFGTNADLPEPAILLPLGISFFTFEFIHYLIEVRRGGEAIESPINFAVFAAFFPTQIAGPIKRYQSFIPQLLAPPRFDWRISGAGLRLIVRGLFKKVVLADTLAPLVTNGFRPQPDALSAGNAWLLAIAFAMQIYLDFSGFTDIARGSARVLGFDVPENFRRPYMSLNPSDFWRRWHMSLSTWLRDYVYIPLGGNRRLRYRNLMLTMLIGGLWHGANWTFVVWGGFHGVLLVGYWLARGAGGGAEFEQPAGAAKGVTSFFSWLLTFTLVCIGWVFFRSTSLDQAFGMVGSMFGFTAGSANPLTDRDVWVILLISIGWLGGEAILEFRDRLKVAGRDWLPARPSLESLRWHLQPVGYALILGLMLILKPPAGAPFIYFHF